MCDTYISVYTQEGKISVGHTKFMSDKQIVSQRMPRHHEYYD